jgi:hypothetical protein
MKESSVFEESALSPLTRRDLYLIIIGGIVSASVSVILVTPERRISELTLLLSTIKIVSMTFSTGLFFFLTAGVLFSSKTSRQYLLRRIELVGARRALLVRVLHAIVFTSLFSVVMTTVAFVAPTSLGWYPEIPINYAAIPSVLIASLIVSASLVSIASFLACLTDDSRLCVLLGCALTIALANLAGWSSDIIHYSLTRNLALLSPHNIFKGLAVLLSGHHFESIDDMVSYVGFVVSTQSIISAISLLVSLSIVLLFFGIRLLQMNLVRWQSLPGMTPLREVWSSAATPEEIRRIKRSLRVQRGLATIIIAILLVSINFGGSAYVSSLENSTTIVHYESPANGETLQIGVWYVFDVNVQPPYPGLFNQLLFRFLILTWGNASDSLSFFFDILEMNPTEFELLDESSRIGLVHSMMNVTFHGGAGYGIGRGLEESYGAYICVLKIISDSNPSENSYIQASLLIEQSAV